MTENVACPTFIGTGSVKIRRANGHIEEAMVVFTQEDCMQTMHWPDGTLLANGDSILLPAEMITMAAF